MCFLFILSPCIYLFLDSSSNENKRVNEILQSTVKINMLERYKTWGALILILDMELR